MHAFPHTWSEDTAVTKPVVLIAEELSPATVEALGPDFEIRTCNGADRGELLPAIADAVPDVRALGALVLAASSGEKARQLLVRALRDSDNKVRKAAAQSLSRIVGEDVSSMVELDDAQRRREIRRISSLPSRPVTRFVEAPKPRRSYAITR